MRALHWTGKEPWISLHLGQNTMSVEVKWTWPQGHWGQPCSLTRTQRRGYFIWRFYWRSSGGSPLRDGPGDNSPLSYPTLCAGEPRQFVHAVNFEKPYKDVNVNIISHCQCPVYTGTLHKWYTNKIFETGKFLIVKIEILLIYNISIKLILITVAG